MDIAGKVFIVTGGASGLGEGAARMLAGEGAKVVVADLNEANGQETLAVARAQGHSDTIAFVRCDVAKEADVAATVAEAEKRFGRLDIAYLNAGVGGAFGPGADQDGRGSGTGLRRAGHGLCRAGLLEGRGRRSPA